MKNHEVQPVTNDKRVRAKEALKEIAGVTGTIALALGIAYPLAASARGYGISDHLGDEDIEELVINSGYSSPEVTDVDSFMPGVIGPCKAFGSIDSFFIGDVVAYEVEAVDSNGNSVDLSVCYDMYIDPIIYVESD